MTIVPLSITTAVLVCVSAPAIDAGTPSQPDSTDPRMTAPSGSSVDASGQVQNGAAASGDLLWDNGLIPNGTGSVPLSPPGFPEVRMVNDIVVSKEGWTIHDLHVNAIEDQQWRHGGSIDTYIYTHDPQTESPGERLTSGADFAASSV